MDNAGGILRSRCTRDSRDWCLQKRILAHLQFPSAAASPTPSWRPNCADDEQGSVTSKLGNPNPELTMLQRREVVIGRNLARL